MSFFQAEILLISFLMAEKNLYQVKSVIILYLMHCFDANHHPDRIYSQGLPANLCLMVWGSSVSGFRSLNEFSG